MPKSDGKRSKNGKGTDKMWNVKFWNDESQDINPSLLADITDSPIKFKKIKIRKDEFQDSYSGVGQSGSQDLFPSEDIFPSTASLEADITPSPKKFKKIESRKDESQDSYSGGPSGSQIFPTQVVEESEDTNEDSLKKEGSKNSLTGEQSTAYAHSNFEELHDVMVNIFRTVWHGRLETFSEASRTFLHFCAVVVSHRNDELLEMIEEYDNSHPQQDISTSGDEYNPEEN